MKYSSNLFLATILAIDTARLKTYQALQSLISSCYRENQDVADIKRWQDGFTELQLSLQPFEELRDKYLDYAIQEAQNAQRDIS